MPKAHCNLANIRVTQGKLDDAVAHFRKALSLNPALATAEMGLAVSLLIQGDFQRGWPAYELPRPCPPTPPMPNPDVPRWRGEPFAGRRLILVAEQGLGDTIHFLAPRGASEPKGLT